MKINEIILEAVKWSADEVAGTIKRDCEPFLAAINNQPERYKLWRGIEAVLPQFSKQKCPVNRPPRDTGPDLHKIIDDWFLETTGIRYRSNAVFAVGNKKLTIEYGEPYLVFPIGEFQFCWSPQVSDLTFDVLDHQLFSYEPDELEIEINDLMPTLGYQTSDLLKASKKRVEIMIHCPMGYYMVGGQYEPGNFQEQVLLRMTAP